MGLKILHTADWHLDSAFSSFSEEQRRILHREQLAIPGKIADLCRREMCDLLLIAGDVFDGKPSREAVDAVRQMMKDCGVPVFVAPGNHDFAAIGSPWKEECWPDNAVVFTGGMEAVVIPQLDVRIYGAGYQGMDCEGLLEGFRASGEQKYQIAVLHGDPFNAQSPYCPITAAQVRDSGLQYLALGHIHKAGMFRMGKTLCAWPGCPMGRGWDETGDKGICIVELNENADIRMLRLDVPRFWALEAELSETAELDDLLPAAGVRDFYRITLTGCTGVDTDTLRKKYGNFPNLFFRDRREAQEDIWEDVESDTFRGAYFRLLKQIAQEDPRAVLAAEISRKILSGREVQLP